MSLCAEVVEELERRGSGTVDDLAPLFPDYTRAQVLRALQWVRFTGQITCDGQPPKTGRKGGAFPATYRAKPRRMVTSVFDLALR
jgi:hypothetical protein